jgi:hypothetical protein
VATNILFEEASAQNAVTGLITNALLDLDRATSGDENVDYKPLYYFLFNGITDVLCNNEDTAQTITALKKLQCDSEELYMDQANIKNGIIRNVRNRP